MSVKQHLITAEELWEMPEVPGKRLELIDGEVVEVSPVGDEHMRIMLMLFKLMDQFADQHDLGLVRPDGLGFVLRRNPDQVRVPDVAFIAAASIPNEGPPNGYWEGPPTLAVEIVSPHDRVVEIDERVQGYLESGTRQVWVLRPNRSAVSVYRPHADTRELGPDAQLDGGDILPGFSVRVGDLFEMSHRHR